MSRHNVPSRHQDLPTRRTFLAAGLGAWVLGRTAPAWSQAPGGRRVALLVGVNTYSKKGFKNLTCCENDVRQMQQALESLGFDEVRMLLGSNDNLAPKPGEANPPATTPPPARILKTSPKS